VLTNHLFMDPFSYQRTWSHLSQPSSRCKHEQK